jgi:cellulose biosynthesis protein BcsQ
MKTITLFHYKGGTGKTTLGLLLCRLLAATGHRVLAIDMDACQNHLSAALGCAVTEETGRGASHSYASGILERVIRKNVVKNLDVAALSAGLCDRGTCDPMHLKKRFRFFNFDASYGFAVIDTPPGMGRVQEISINAADEICVPTDLSPPSLQSLDRLLATIGRKLKIRVVPNSILELRSSAGRLAALVNRFPGKVLPFCVPYDEKLQAILSPSEEPFFIRMSNQTAYQCCRLAAELFPVNRKVMENAVDDERRMLQPFLLEHHAPDDEGSNKFDDFHVPQPARPDSWPVPAG